MEESSTDAPQVCAFNLIGESMRTIGRSARTSAASKHSTAPVSTAPARRMDAILHLSRLLRSTAIRLSFDRSSPGHAAKRAVDTDGRSSLKLRHNGRSGSFNRPFHCSFRAFCELLHTCFTGDLLCSLRWEFQGPG